MSLDPRTTSEHRTRRPGARMAAVVSRYHGELTGAMLQSALVELAASGIPAAGVRVVEVPGAFEIPLVARELARRSDVDAVLTFGLVLRGETSHDHWVAHGAVSGLVQASLETGKPIALGILTCSTLAQARARALPASRGGKLDKGREIARAALEALAALEEARSGGKPAPRRASTRGRARTSTPR